MRCIKPCSLLLPVICVVAGLGRGLNAPFLDGAPVSDCVYAAFLLLPLQLCSFPGYGVIKKKSFFLRWWLLKAGVQLLQLQPVPALQVPPRSIHLAEEDPHHQWEEEHLHLVGISLSAGELLLVWLLIFIILAIIWPRWNVSFEASLSSLLFSVLGCAVNVPTLSKRLMSLCP